MATLKHTRKEADGGEGVTENEWKDLAIRSVCVLRRHGVITAWLGGSIKKRCVDVKGG